MAHWFVDTVASGSGSGGDAGGSWPARWASAAAFADLDDLLADVANGDTVNIAENRYDLPGSTGAAHARARHGGTIRGRKRTVDAPGFARIVGDRSRWLRSGNIAVNGVAPQRGKPIVFELHTGADGLALEFLAFSHLQNGIESNLDSPRDHITVTLRDVRARHVEALLWQDAFAGGMVSVDAYRCVATWYTHAGIKNFGGSYQEDCHFDSMRQFFSSGITPFGFHYFGHRPGYTKQKFTFEGRRCWYNRNAPRPEVWSAGENYIKNRVVSYADATAYIAQVASGPGSGGAVTPGTDDNVWKPLGYQQGDGAVLEEGIEGHFFFCGAVGNADRGFDLKAWSEFYRCWMDVNGYGMAQHVNWPQRTRMVQSYVGTGRRENAEASVVANIQAAGTQQYDRCRFGLLPSLLTDPEPDTASRYAYAKLEVAQMSFQQGLLAPTRVGDMVLNDSEVIADAGLPQGTAANNPSGAVWENGRTFIASGLTPNTAYTPSDWTVVAFDQAGTYSAARTLSSTPLPADWTGTVGPPPTTLPQLQTTPFDYTVPPSKVTGLHLVGTPGAHDFTVAWDEATDDIGVYCYVILLDGVPSAWTFQASFTLRNLKAATTYAVTVKAVDFSQNYGAASNAIPGGVTTAAGTNDARTLGTPASLLVARLTTVPGTAQTSIMFVAGIASGSPAGYELRYQGSAVARNRVGNTGALSVAENRQLRLLNQGTWSGSTDYAAGDAVITGGAVWEALAPSGPGHGGPVTPATTAAAWRIRRWSYTGRYDPDADYVHGQITHHDGAHYRVRAPSGPGHGGAVTPGTDPTVWTARR